MDLYTNREEYRTLTDRSSLQCWRTTIRETDLYLAAGILLKEEAERAVRISRGIIEQEIRHDPDFLTSLVPLAARETDDSLIRSMKQAGFLAKVGPMAAVAGAIAEYVGRSLLKETDRVIVENGGDVFLCSPEPLRIGIYAPGSPLSGKLGLLADAAEGLGVCTSSGTYGHSLSFGRSQAAVAVSGDTALADAAATRLGNLLKNSDAIEPALEEILTISGITGAVAIVNDRIGILGEIELTAI